MNRRTLLARALAAGTVLVAGCADGGETPRRTGTTTATPTSTVDGTTTPTRDRTDTRTETPTQTETPTPTDGSTSTPTSTPTPTETSTPTSTPTPTETSTPSPEPDQTVVVGPGGDLRFDPDTFTVSTGATVLWTWDSGGHNVHPTSQPGGASWPGKDEDLTYPAGSTHAYTFEVAGNYDYVCQPHQSSGMTGSFRVE